MNNSLDSYYVVTALTNAESRIYLNNAPCEGEPRWTCDLENASRFNTLKEVTECKLPAGHLTRNATDIHVMVIMVTGQLLHPIEFKEHQ